MAKHRVFSLADYAKLLKGFLRANYEFVAFPPRGSVQPTHNVIWRHDIDFSVEAAVQVALIEHDLGIGTTYFFQLRSALYNLLSTRVGEQLLKIHEYGHDLALHFDPHQYERQTEDHVMKELESIELFYPYFRKDIISIHQPGNLVSLNNYTSFPQNIQHTYQKEFFRDIKYFSDSKGEWRFGYPLDSKEFANHISMQVTTHPLWWVMQGENAVDKLASFLEGLRSKVVTDLENGVVSFSLQNLQIMESNKEKFV